jgi:hypothetical protein
MSTVVEVYNPESDPWFALVHSNRSANNESTCLDDIIPRSTVVTCKLSRGISLFVVT